MNEPTNFTSCNVIDLVFCSHSYRVGNVEVLAPFPSCSHGVLFYEDFYQESNSTRGRGKKDRLWSRVKYDLISRSLQTIDCHFELSHLDVEKMYDRLCSILYPLIERFVPLVDSRKTSEIPWAKKSAFSFTA